MANMTDVRRSLRKICAAAVRHFTPLEQRSKPRLLANLVYEKDGSAGGGNRINTGIACKPPLRTVSASALRPLKGVY
jgi:hypothetical protein